MHILIHWLMSAIAITVTAYLLPGVHIANFTAALTAAAVLGIANAILRPILLFFTLPITILTLGLFTLIINAAMILLTARLVPGFQVDGLGWAIIFGIILWIVNVLLYRLAGT